jgi:hypothetical protein
MFAAFFIIKTVCGPVNHFLPIFAAKRHPLPPLYRPFPAITQRLFEC